MRQNILIAVGVVIILLVSLIFSEWMSMSIGMLVHEASIFSSYFKCNEIKMEWQQFLTNFIRCRTSFRMLFRLSLTMSLPRM